MAEEFDVAVRLAEGRPAVEDFQTYAAACHALGFGHQDLTTPADDWYDTEIGLDLRALDADCTRLQSAVAATEEARDLQDGQLAALADSWGGAGARSAREFLRRHGEASAQAAAVVRTAAEALAELRDSLWRAVDAKVAATLAVDARARAHRGDWLAAAHTVTSGTGDLASASELIDLHVKPFVANDIGTDWVAAMRTSTDEVATAYDVATARLTAGDAAAFEVPAEWGPVTAPVSDVASTVPAGLSVPATPPVEAAAPSGPAGLGASLPSAGAALGWSAPAGAMPWAAGAMPWSGGAPPPAPPPPPPATVEPASAPIEPPAAAPFSSPSAMPSMGGGLPDVGAGLSGLGSQFADMLGGLLGSTDGGLPGLDDSEPPDLDEDLDVDDDEPDDTDDPEDDEVEDDTNAADELTEPSAAGDATMDAAAPGGPPEECADAPAADLPDEAPAPPATAPIEPPAPAAPAPIEPPAPIPPPPAEPLVVEGAPPGAATPCEIAADELPQAGP